MAAERLGKAGSTRKRRPPILLLSHHCDRLSLLVIDASTVACAGSLDEGRREIRGLGERDPTLRCGSPAGGFVIDILTPP